MCKEFLIFTSLDHLEAQLQHWGKIYKELSNYRMAPEKNAQSLAPNSTLYLSLLES